MGVTKGFPTSGALTVSLDYHVSNREGIVQAERNTCKEALRCEGGWGNGNPLRAIECRLLLGKWLVMRLEARWSSDYKGYVSAG